MWRGKVPEYRERLSEAIHPNQADKDTEYECKSILSIHVHSFSHLVRLTVAEKPNVFHSNSPVPDPGSPQSVPKQTESEVTFTQSSRRNGNRDRYSAPFSDARWPPTTHEKVVDFLLRRLCTACFVSVQWRLSSKNDPVSESGCDPPLVEHRREQLSASASLSKRAPFGLVWMSLTLRQRTLASNWACFYYSVVLLGYL